jgi:hypothetical protein
VHLPERLVEDNADGGGEVEAADLAGRHGDAEHAAGAGLADARGQAFRFIAEEEAVAIAKPGPGVRQVALRLDDPEAGVART